VGLHQIKKLLHSKETINKMTGQPTVYEKICANHVSDKVTVLKIINNSYNSIVEDSTIKNGQRY
jgi:hypothetical protein